MQMLDLQERLGKLPYYTKQNLGLALGKEQYALDYWMKELIKSKVLIPLKKGLYVSAIYLALVKERGETEGYLEYLAGIIRTPSYLSLEYMLAKNGIIPEAAFALTSVTRKTTRSYRSDLASFYYRNIKPQLFTGFIQNKYGKQTVNVATPAKALFDYLYLRTFINEKAMASYLLSDGRINWDSLTLNDRQMFSQFIELSDSKKMQRIEKILKVNRLL